MQVSVCLCKFEMYIYAAYYDKWKTFWEFRVFSTFAETFYIFTFHFFAFSLILDNLQKTKTDTKSRIFAVFARKRPFLSQIKR